MDHALSTQLAQVVDEIVGEAVIIIDQKKHDQRIRGAGPRRQVMGVLKAVIKQTLRHIWAEVTGPGDVSLNMRVRIENAF